ncbi:ABC-type Zn2+ transport system substrate-binding protein/surface adhesin [Bacillus sp. OAE603]
MNNLPKLKLKEIKKDNDNKKSDDQLNDSKNENEQSIDDSKEQDDHSKDKPKN